jgi:hypothetical protein
VNHGANPDGRRTAALVSARSADRAIDELVMRVTTVRSRIVDSWEATALVESLGYTDARVRAEFGLRDTRAAGEQVYARMTPCSAPAERWSPPNPEPAVKIVVRSAASTLIYAVPWLAIFVAQVVRPNVMRLPTQIAPAVALALMFSLIASGGVVQALVRRGEFYVGLDQPEMARQVIRAILRAGIVAVVAVALAAILLGWYFELFAWASLVLGADAFIIMSVLWMVCGAFAIRQQQWRVAAAFAVGFAAFATIRIAGADVITAQWAAAAVVVAVAAVQLRRVLGVRSRAGLPRGVQMPRFSVLLYWTVPYFWYGTVYFAFLFADRIAAGAVVATATGGPFSVPAQYNFGMELALLTLLLAASGVEVAGALFARAMRNEAARPLMPDSNELTAALRRHYKRSIALTLVTFAVTAVLIAMLAHRMLPNAFTLNAKVTLLVGDAGYCCLALGLLNALLLFETGRPWTVVREFTIALGINVASGYVLSHVLTSFHVVDGLLLGAAYFAAASTIAVRRTLQRPDYAYAMA